MIFLLFLFASSSVFLVESDATTGSQCTAPKISKVKFSYNSFRSKTGQMTSQVVFDHDVAASLSTNKTSPWSLDVEQTTATTCEGDRTINVVANITQGRSRTPVGADYELFHGVGYYKLHTEASTWALARKTCADEGAHLVIVNSEIEANVMKQIFARNADLKGDRTDALWLGVYETAVNGNYLTIFGDTLASTGFTRWANGHPNSAGHSDCFWLYRASTGLVDWNNCSSKFPFVCELGF